MSLLVSSPVLGGGGWIIGRNNMKMTEMQEIMDSFEENSVLKSKDKPENLQDLIAGLHELFADEVVNIDLVQKWMESYPGNKNDWRKFEKIDKYRYTRNLVDEGNGKFNLMLLAWGEGMGSSIHDHADSHCCMKILEGELKETMYEWPKEKDGGDGDTSSGSENGGGEEGEGMKKKSARVLGRGSVAYINDSIGLHRVENASDSCRAVSLHVYSPPFDECQSFDERSGRRNQVKVTFFSKFGERTPFKPAKGLAENN